MIWVRGDGYLLNPRNLALTHNLVGWDFLLAIFLLWTGAGWVAYFDMCGEENNNKLDINLIINLYNTYFLEIYNTLITRKCNVLSVNISVSICFNVYIIFD